MVQSKRRNKSSTHHQNYKRPSLRVRRSNVRNNNRETNNENARGPDGSGTSASTIDSNQQQQQPVNEELPERWKNWQQFYDTQQQGDNSNDSQHNNHHHHLQQHPTSESGGDTTARNYNENHQQRPQRHHTSTATADESATHDDSEEIRTDVNHIPSMATKLEGEEREQYVQELMARHREEASKRYGQSLMASSKSSTRDRATESSRHYTKHLREHAILMVPPPVREGEPPVKTRVRRSIMEGSYPNWSVNEEGLSSVLRYRIIRFLKIINKSLLIPFKSVRLLKLNIVMFIFSGTKKPNL